MTRYTKRVASLGTGDWRWRILFFFINNTYIQEWLGEFLGGEAYVVFYGKAWWRHGKRRNRALFGSFVRSRFLSNPRFQEAVFNRSHPRVGAGIGCERGTPAEGGAQDVCRFVFFPGKWMGPLCYMLFFFFFLLMMISLGLSSSAIESCLQRLSSCCY